jgi:hypothetical protein
MYGHRSDTSSSTSARASLEPRRRLVQVQEGETFPSTSNTLQCHTMAWALLVTSEMCYLVWRKTPPPIFNITASVLVTRLLQRAAAIPPVACIRCHRPCQSVNFHLNITRPHRPLLVHLVKSSGLLVKRSLIPFPTSRRTIGFIPIITPCLERSPKRGLHDRKSMKYGVWSAI